MSNVVLILPKYDMSRIMTAKKEELNKSITNLQQYPSLGITYLASVLEQNNFNTIILDMSASSFTQEDVVKIVKRENPLIIGIYVISCSLHSTYILIKKIKKSIKTKIIIGGDYVTHNPSAVVHLDADYGFRGEAELNFPLIVKCIKENKEPENIVGLVKRKNKKTFCNGIASVENLDSIPFPARHLLPNEKYYNPFFKGRMAIMVTSRGCTFDCIFCSSHTQKIRARSSENIVKEIEHLVHSGFDFILIEDDFFTFDRKRIERICKLMIKKKIKIKWDCSTRADFVDLDLLRLMKEAGCSLINIGVECEDENIRNKVIGKKISNEKIITAFKNAKKAGIRTMVYCMFGHPGETLNHMERTLKFVLKINPDYADFALSTIVSGSKLFNIALKEKKINKKIWLDLIKGDELIPVYIPQGIALEDLRGIQKRAFLKFYFRPKKILQELENTRNISDFLFKLRIIFKLFKYF